MIEYRNVHKHFGRQVVLAGVDLTVARGECVAIVGTSGSGKSVLLKTTVGLLNPDWGDIRIDGRSVASGDRHILDEVRRRVGYVFQSAALFDSLTVYENVRMGVPEAELSRLPGEEVVERVQVALESVNLDPGAVLYKMPSELSGGMRKRVGLARAIVGRPVILLYDEPVTGLDPVTSATINQLMARTNERLGATSLLVTHDIEGALEIADRVALLHKGRLRFVGSPRAFRNCDDPLVRAFADREAAMRAAAGGMEEA